VTRRTAPAAARSATAARASARSASRAAAARPAPTDRRAREIERTRQDIIEAAARVFGTSGWRDATMQVIAKEAGFTAASLYTYFKSKEEIFDALLLDLNRNLLASFDEHVPAGLTFEQRLELLLHRQLAFVASRREAIRIAFDRAPRRMHPDHGPAEYLRRLARFLDEAGARLRLPTPDAARLLFGMLHATLLPSLLEERSADPAQDATRIIDLFLHGAVRAG
jgi:AcrR family transcriptional regulator